MEIKRIRGEDRKAYLDLLLLGDEQLDMVLRYIDRGDMFVLYDDGIAVSEAIVCEAGQRVFEIKNIATYSEQQGRGYGSALLGYIAGYYKENADILYVGTGENRRTLDFYRHAGFVFSHKVRNFFTENYDHPIFEDGHQLVDMIYLKKALR